MLANDIRTMMEAPRVEAPRAITHSGGAHDYSRNPMLVYWETTHACALACRHCRAEASSSPLSDELSHAEGIALLRQIASFTPQPHLVLTGGDPLMRADIFELIDEARRLGLAVSVTPSVTPALTCATMEKLKEHGIDSLGLSLDGSTAERHEGVRGVQGCFEWTMQALKDAAALKIPVQVNTLVSEETLDDLPHIYELLKGHTIMCWSLFFLVAVGRGRELNPITAEQAERCMEWIFDRGQDAPFRIKTTEAPSYRRVALNRMRDAGWPMDRIRKSPMYRGFGIRDGHGVVFISNQGYIYPAGFLPLVAGNVRHDHLVDVYRNSAIFRSLHAPETFHGKCARCEYRALCGGSRARSFAATGDPLASDPLCVYEPPQLHSESGAASCAHCAQCKNAACARS